VANNESSWPSSLIAKNISYEVPSKESKSNIKLLDNVNVHFRCGRMTCLMGTSGAGKSTFLDVIAGYKTGGTITGDVLIDGRVQDLVTWKKISGYAEQQDILNPYLSVLETLRFTANCRLPKNSSKEEVVRRVIKLMDIEEWGDSIIGREKDGEGLPKHVRKRVTIANGKIAISFSFII
jgi:ABC-type multidrug transport system ATPase subunit